VWNAFSFSGSLATAKAVLSRWPHLAQLAAARRARLTAVVAEHTRDVPDVPARAEVIRAADVLGAWHIKFGCLRAILTSPPRSPRVLDGGDVDPEARCAIVSRLVARVCPA